MTAVWLSAMGLDVVACKDFFCMRMVILDQSEPCKVVWMSEPIWMQSDFVIGGFGIVFNIHTFITTYGDVESWLNTT